MDCSFKQSAVRYCRSLICDYILILEFCSCDLSIDRMFRILTFLPDMLKRGGNVLGGRGHISLLLTRPAFCCPWPLLPVHDEVASPIHRTAPREWCPASGSVAQCAARQKSAKKSSAIMGTDGTERKCCDPQQCNLGTLDTTWMVYTVGERCCVS